MERMDIEHLHSGKQTTPKVIMILDGEKYLFKRGMNKKTVAFHVSAEPFSWWVKGQEMWQEIPGHVSYMAQSNMSVLRVFSGLEPGWKLRDGISSLRNTRLKHQPSQFHSFSYLANITCENLGTQRFMCLQAKHHLSGDFECLYLGSKHLNIPGDPLYT